MTTPEIPGAEEVAEESGLLASVKEAIKARLSSPLFGAIVVAWLFLNWRALLFLVLDDRVIVDRIKYADAEYFTAKSMTIYPLAAGVAFVIFSPILSWVLDRYRGVFEAKISNRKIEEVERLLNHERLVRDPEGFKAALRRLNEDVERAEEALATLKEQAAATKARADANEAESTVRIAQMERDIVERRAKAEDELVRTKAAVDQHVKDIAGMSADKERLLAQIRELQKTIGAAKDEREFIKAERDRLAHENSNLDSERLKNGTKEFLQETIAQRLRAGEHSVSIRRDLERRGVDRKLLLQIFTKIGIDLGPHAPGNSPLDAVHFSYRVNGDPNATRTLVKTLAQVSGVTSVATTFSDDGTIKTFEIEGLNRDEVRENIERVFRSAGIKFTALKVLA